MTGKVIWSEGMFIQPQHFQQQERYLLDVVHNRIRSVSQNAFGFRKLKISASELDFGQISLTECSCVFPDGTSVNAPESDSLPLPIKVEDAVRDAFVYLALPISQTTSAEVGINDESGSLIRYLPLSKDIQDVSRQNGRTANLELGDLRCRLFVEEQSNIESNYRVPDGYITLRVAHIEEVISGKIKLNDKFIPTVVDVSASPTVHEYISSLLSIVATRADSLAAKVTGRSGKGGVAQGEDYLLLIVLNKTQPVLEQFKLAQGVHPFQFFQFLVSLSGELATFMKPNKRPISFPVYDHQKLYECLMPVMDDLVQSFTVVMDEAAIAIELSAPKGGIRAARLTDKNLLENSFFVLAVKADIPTDTLRVQFPAQIKIGPGEKIFQLVQSALPGIRLIELPTSPKEIPYHSGYLYFELSSKEALWQELNNSKGMAFHMSGQFPGLEMELWAVKRR